MNDINSVILVGRITKDLDGRSFAYTQSGVARANVSIAVNRSRKSQNGWEDEVSYFDVNIWGKTAENLKPYLVKGKRLGVEGVLKQERWEKEGQKHSKVVINAVTIQLLDGGEKKEAPQHFQQEQRIAPTEQTFEEDIPF